ncbi:fibroblast growth factor-binding protein 2 [Seriola dumerili]|uniref:fibroblast growth factor-binding protein 2 n=1 Tax=Seriola dumerili TaxID=41447 RepID=UPI000BBF0818|nr:fibroblast growth factor-binding protein 2 [Seriola dumerili]
MRARMRVLLLVLAATVFVSNAQTNNSSNDNKQQQQQQQQQQQERSIWDESIKFTTKTKDSCTMVVSGAGDYTRLRVSCKGPSQGQTPGRSYYCDFQGKPNLCRAYNLNPRHYFTQMMWELRKLSHACQGPKVYRTQMCKKYPDEAQMTFLASWPKTTTPKPSKPVQEPRKPVVPAQTKPVTTPKPVKPQPQQPVKPQPGKGPQTRKTTPKPGKTTTRPTEQPDSKASRIASEYCWKSFQGICTYVISWFQN